MSIAESVIWTVALLAVAGLWQVALWWDPAPEDRRGRVPRPIPRPYPPPPGRVPAPSDPDAEAGVWRSIN